MIASLVVCRVIYNSRDPDSETTLSTITNSHEYTGNTTLFIPKSRNLTFGGKTTSTPARRRLAPAPRASRASRRTGTTRFGNARTRTAVAKEKGQSESLEVWVHCMGKQGTCDVCSCKQLLLVVHGKQSKRGLKQRVGFGKAPTRT
jgi:hypothetical protein